MQLSVQFNLAALLTMYYTYQLYILHFEQMNWLIDRMIDWLQHTQNSVQMQTWWSPTSPVIEWVLALFDIPAFALSPPAAAATALAAALAAAASAAPTVRCIMRLVMAVSVSCAGW